MPEQLAQLWAPWRAAYVGGSPPAAGCPFCVAIEAPSSSDRESWILHRGRGCFVVLNAYPYNPGHLMVLPNAHFASLAELDVDVARELWELTCRAVDVVQDRLGAEGVNVGLNLGSAAGAGIAGHLHQHVVPRWNGDTNFMTTTATTRVLPQALDDVWRILHDFDEGP